MIRPVVGGGGPTCLKQKKKELSAKEQGVGRRDTKRDGSAASAGLQPGKPAPAPLRSKSDWSRPPRERGRPARILSLCLPLSFPAMRQPATLPAGTAWARPKQSPGVFAGRSGSRRWARLCQDFCGRDARAPGGLHPMTWSHQGGKIAGALRGRLCLKEVHLFSCSFVSIRGSSSFNRSRFVFPCMIGRAGARPPES